MEKLKELIKKHKIIFIISFLIVFLSIIVSIPSLAKLKNRTTIYTVSSWDGTIATSYKKGDGTKENPYIISNASEYAFFNQQLKTTNYEGIYFELSNDIVINEGIFEYDEAQGLKYILDDITYYVDDYSNEYYDNSQKTGQPIGKVNMSTSIQEFKGNLNGNSFTIYGMYLADSLNYDLGLIKNLEGTINNIYITNSVVYGIGNVSGVIVNSNNSTINNLIYNGYVVNRSETSKTEIDIEPFSIQTSNQETINTININQEQIEGLIKSIKITGEYESTNDEIDTIKINGIEILNNSFEIELGNELLNEIPVYTISQSEETVVNFKNIKYIIEYYNDITAGIISNSKNTSLTNVINKGNIYGNYVSSGIIGKSNEGLNIIQSYNTGTIKSEFVASGIVGVISNNSNHTTIKNTYNKGLINSATSGAILGKSNNNTGIINFENCINVSNTYAINTVENSVVNVVNSYSINGLSTYSGEINGSFVQKEEQIINTKEFMLNNSYNEFISFNDVEKNYSNAWIYENTSLPILYIDDLNNPIANLNVNKYSWNNLSSELNMLDISTNITFSIEDTSLINPAKEKYYYIDNSRVPLTEEQLNNLTTWSEYDDIVKIETSGYYIIYAKIIDQTGNITYINTDILVLNTSGFKAEISDGNNTWTKLENELEDIYFNEDIKLSILAENELDSIASVQYYIANDKLSEEQIKNISTWQQYVDIITITEKGKYVVYVKVVDGLSNIKYVNTDYLIYGGYKETLNLGNNNTNYDSNYITNKSSIAITFESDFEYLFKEGDSHNLITNILLPEGTKITLIDKKNNKVYKKTIDTNDDLYNYESSCDGLTSCIKYATYRFDSFKEIGVSTISNYNEEKNYNQIITNEKYVILINFEDTNMVDNYYDLSFFVAIKDTNDDFVYQTFNKTIEKINIYSTVDNKEIKTTHTLQNDYNNQSIYYNSNSEISINFTDIITYTTINNKNIIDTKYINKKDGLSIKLYDSDGLIINKKYLENIIFEVNEKEYFANKDNEIIINFGSIISDKTKKLKIKTKANSSDLKNGTYYLKIGNFVSDDGYNYDYLNKNEIVIPVIVNNETPITPNYNFNVQMQTESTIIQKSEEENVVSFNITYTGELKEPNIRISLYEKEDLTAYNQKYKIVDLGEYTTDTLLFAETNKYFIDVNNSIFNINLDSTKFNNNGYKYLFELYDGTRKISQLEKYFITK